MKKLITFLLNFFVLTFMTMDLVFAQTTVNANLISNKVDLKSGQEVEITFKLDDYNDVNKGINAYKATLEYDKNIFEEVLKDSFKCLNGWESLLYNPLNNQFVSIKKFGSTKEENVVKIKLKVKENVNTSKTNIKVKDIVVSEGIEDIFVQEKTISLNINKEKKIVGTSTIYNKKIVNKNTKDDNIMEKEPESNNDKDKYDKTDNKDIKIKKTSTRYFILFLLFLLQILIIILIIFILKKKKEKEEEKKEEKKVSNSKNKKKHIIFFIVVFLSLEFIGTTCKALYDFSKKGELNDDNVINYSDVNLIESHLISLDLLPLNKHENADINSDGKITVTDLTLLIQKIEDALDYEVTLTNINSENNFPSKNDEVELSFNAEASYSSRIEKVIINDIEYNVIQKDNKYIVKLKVPNKAGIYEYKISEVSLNNNKKIEVDYKFKIDILKDKPSIDNYEVREEVVDVNNYKLNISFDLKDNDNSVTSSTIVIKNDKSEIVTKKDITKGKNNIVVPVIHGKHYKVYIDVNYDLDSNKLESDKDHSSTLSIEKDLMLVTKTDLTISNINTFKNNVKTNYFKKSEKIDIEFESTNITDFKTIKAVINKKEYDLEYEQGKYKTTLDSFSSSGLKEIIIESIILDDTNQIVLDGINSVKIEILKDKPSVKNFTFEETEDGKINVTFDVIDNDNTISSGNVVIKDENNINILNKVISTNKNLVTFAMNASDIYNAIIIASYDLDSNTLDNNSNAYSKVLFEEKISTFANVIELKDVISNELYDSNNNKINILDITDGIPNNLDDYYVKINMKTLPTYYASVKSIKKDGNKLNITIDQTQFIMYKENTQGYNKINNYTFQIPYKDENGEQTLVKSASELFSKIGKNPHGNYTLTENLDASSITSNPSIPYTFKGTLDGNGYKIINLSSALFNELNGATIKNLVIENARITNNSKGIIANTVTNNSLIQNVHIKNSFLNNNQYPVGGFTGKITNSTIKESSAVNINISANNTIGGIAGNMDSLSVIDNCYATGSIRGTHNHNTLGARVGGITGWHGGNKIDHCYTNVTISVPKDLGGGGLIGGPDRSHPVIKNSVSLGSGNGYRISGHNNINNMSNVYEYSNSERKTNILENTTTIKSITNIYDKNFFKETLGFDESIWNLDLLEHNKLPKLKNDSMPNEIKEYEILENKNNIPNYGEVRNNIAYSKIKEIAYYNLSKLMPFENTKNWVKMGNSTKNDSLLNTTKIKFILPLDSKNKLINSLGRNNADKIKKIRVIYTNDKTEEFNVTYKQTIEKLVAVYTINGSKIEYQYDNYLTNIDEELLNNAIEKANNLDYSSQIASITSENESRLYVDFYHENVKGNIKEIINNYISNNQDIPTYSNNKIVKSLINPYLSEDKLIRLLYAYNYYDKWYRIDLDGVKVSDLMLFNGKKLNNTMTTTYLINSVINTSSSNRATNKTENFYNAFIKGKVGKSLPDYLAYLFKVVNGYNNPSDWMIDHFDGLIYEQKAISPISDQITYRIWPIMTGSSYNMHMLLPILSAPQEDMYIISCPSQYIIGSLNRYPTYLNKDGKERDRMLDLMKNYANNLGLFYGVSSSFIPNASNRINNIINVQFDTRFNFPASSKADAGTQSSGTTKDPVMKWVYEAIGNAWGAANGTGAYADGDNVWWIIDTALGYNRAVHVFTHETAHNQDNRYFYSGNGRRPNTGAEAHADGVISQDISTYTTVFNLTKKFALDSDYTTNLSYERINSADKIYSYYKEMYETKYVLEYLSAQAFLKLTPEEQAKVSVQLQHNTGTNYTTNYVRLTIDQIRNMNLKTIEDLWDNKLAIRSTGSSPRTWDGSYGHDSFYNLYFYIPNNPDGTPDTNTFKNTGYEMLGYAGYDKGFITYMSGRSKNDLDAIRKITDDDDMTWKKYKMSRYDNVRNNLNKINYYDTDALIDLYKRAFEADAKNGNLNVSQAVTKLYYGIAKRATNDFSKGGIYSKESQISITSAEEFINLLNSNTTGSYRIDADLDFSLITIPEGNNYYISHKFIGTIDGNGHKLTGVKYTLFKEIAYAGIKNLTIERPTYSDNATASVALSGKSFDLYNVKVNDSNLGVSHVNKKSGMYFSSDTNTITTRNNEIHTIEDLLAISKSNVALTKSYILTNDIDLSSLDRTGNPIIGGTFSGTIEGNGHQISNQKDVLFNSVTGTIRNIKIENANITSNNAKGIFSNRLSKATIEGISINNSSIVNSTSSVGGLSGGIASSKVNKISLTNVTVKADNTLGGLAGEISSGTVSNILFTGKVLGTTTSIYNLGSRAGGITGWLNSGATIKNVVTKAEINGYEKKGNGGIIGGPNSGNVNIINSISLSAGTKAYRIAGYNVLNNVSNVYEYSSSNSATNITDSNNTKVLSATYDDIINSNFYTDSIKLDIDIWNFDYVSSGGLPKLIGVTSSNAQIKNLFKPIANTQSINDVITDENNLESVNSTEETDAETITENTEIVIENTNNQNDETITKDDNTENTETITENSDNVNSDTIKEEVTNDNSETVTQDITDKTQETNPENSDNENSETIKEKVTDNSETDTQDVTDKTQETVTEDSDNVNSEVIKEEVTDNSETIVEDTVNENSETDTQNVSDKNTETIKENNNENSETITEKNSNENDETTKKDTSSQNSTKETKNINEETTSTENNTNETQEVVLNPSSDINNNLME